MLNAETNRNMFAVVWK